MAETILVTGAAGFIGFHVSRALLERGDKVIGYDNLNDYYDVKLKEDRLEVLEDYDKFSFYHKDITNPEEVRSVFDENEIGRVCHLAAEVGVRYSLVNPMAYYRTNIEGFINVIEMAKQHELSHFVYASSSSVYGGNEKMPFSVEDRVDRPISVYAATKKSDELIAYVYHHLYGMFCTGLRFFTVYGPWGRPDMALFKFTRAILSDESIEVYNQGQMKRDFTYVDDIVSGVVAALDKPQEFAVLNLGNSSTVNLNDFIGRIEESLGKTAERCLLPMQPGDVPETCADIEESRKILGFEPRVGIEEGVRKFIEWYREYYNV